MHFAIDNWYENTKRFEDERSLRSNHSIIILETHKAGLKCTTASLEKLNAEYLALKKEYDSSQENIVGEILGVVSKRTKFEC